MTTRGTSEAIFDVPDLDALPRLELDRTSRSAPRYVTGCAPRFVPAPIECPYCGALRPSLEDECTSCGHTGVVQLSRAQRTAPALPVALVSPPRFATGLLDALTVLPFAFWKRVPAYALLLMLLGNGCTCAGLSSHTNLALVVLIVIGLAGVAAWLQRKP